MVQSSLSHILPIILKLTCKVTVAIRQPLSVKLIEGNGHKYMKISNIVARAFVNVLMFFGFLFFVFFNKTTTESKTKCHQILRLNFVL